MPRGPGKKENYNFDYSRFNGADQDDEDVIQSARGEGDIDMQDVVKQLPGELQEAFRLMQISRQTGDEKARERANALALQAVERGGPEMKQRFQQELLRQAAQNPEAKTALEGILSGGAPAPSPAARAGAPVTSESLAEDGRRMDDLSKQIDQMQVKFKEGQDNANRQLEAMQRQQQELEGLRTPEDFARFMEGQGITPEDLQRAMSGDEAHLKNVFERSLGKLEGAPEVKENESKKLDAMLSTVDQIHRELGGDLPDGRAPEPAAAPTRAPAAPATPEPKIPEHRVQYAKDESGRLLSVQLTCELPGVRAMDDIEVDVSEKHLRLRTLAPAYVVNVGPFPNLVDAPAARAKFSKKRHELTLTVPAQA